MIEVFRSSATAYLYEVGVFVEFNRLEVQAYFPCSLFMLREFQTVTAESV